MYRANVSIILEDRFGREHQFLKGHKYTIGTESADEFTCYFGSNWVRETKRNCYLLSKKQIEEYFEYVEPPLITGGQGSTNLTSYNIL